MQKNMQLYAAVFRTGSTLNEGRNKMQDIYSKLKDIKVRIIILLYLSER